MKFILALLLLVARVLVAQETLPYFNTFDNLPTDTVGWVHFAPNGIDEWEVGYPNQGSISNSISSPNVWMTDLDNSYAPNSTMVLESPYFDLSNASTYSSLSFSRVSSFASGTTIKFYYSTNGMSWTLFNTGATNAEKKNWQGVNGFSNGCCQYVSTSIDISSLAGQIVKFRFVLSSGTSTGVGFVLEDFKIDEPYFNVTAIQADSVLDINPNFTEFTLEGSFIFNNQYQHSLPFKNVFYLSTDQVIDGSDIILDTVTTAASSSISNYNNTFDLPTGLAPGFYYVLYRYDVEDVLAENNESDNESFGVIEIKPLILPNYQEDFDSNFNPDHWEPFNTYPNLRWEAGDPEKFHIPNANSGNNAIFSHGTSSWNNGLLPGMQSPYFSFEGTTNNTFCYWYNRQVVAASGTGIAYLIHSWLDTDGIINEYEQNFDYGTIMGVPNNPRVYGWDCHCEDLSFADNQPSVRFRLFGVHDYLEEQNIAIDDIYIGQMKPDLSIGGERFMRYMNTTTVVDTIEYHLFNSGQIDAAPSITKFYWSNDSILDGGDLLLGVKNELPLDSMGLSVRSFSFTKPTTTPGVYYLFFEVDEGGVIDEMREYNNVNYFEVEIVPTKPLPYENDFEIETDGWTHHSILGADQWEHGIPTGTEIDTAFSGVKAWATNLSGNLQDTVLMYLATPNFTLNTLNEPVVEFDIRFQYLGGWVNMTESNVNLMYSKDNGFTWQAVVPQSTNYKQFYRPHNYQTLSGDDQIHYTSYYGNYLYHRNNYRFRHTDILRDYDTTDHEHFAVNIDHLLPAENIRFMFVIGNRELIDEGILIDNFELGEAKHDFLIQDQKKLMLSSEDEFVHFFCQVKNNDNSMSPPTDVAFYLSADTLLDGTDYSLHAASVPEIRPYYKHFMNWEAPAPSNLSQYNYLIYSIDTSNLIVESDEGNNIGFLQLNMDTAANYQYPMLFDFDDRYVDGWTWYQDSVGFRHGARISQASRDYEFNPFENPQPDKCWRLDMVEALSSGYNWDDYDSYFIQSPPFDFSQLDSVDVSFDFKCFGGGYYGGTYQQGANLQYSSDGGLNWTTITNSMSSNKVNWYWTYDNQNHFLEALGGEPGWKWFNNWTQASINLDTLAGYESIRFRFQYRGEGIYASPAENNHGFRLDNFLINAQGLDYILQTPGFVDTLSGVPSQYAFTFEVQNQGVSVFGDDHISNYYWSQDSILDAGDLLIGSDQFPAIASGATESYSANITIPYPLSSSVNYILYNCDGTDVITETNENNNISYVKLVFIDSTLNLVASDYFELISLTSGSTTFTVDYDITSESSLNTPSSETEFYWSLDTIVDGGDLLIHTELEPPFQFGVNSNSLNLNIPMVTIQNQQYLIYLSDAANAIIELNEFDNRGIFLVEGDSTATINELEGVILSYWKPNQLVLFNSLNRIENMDIKLYNSIGQVVCEWKHTDIDLGTTLLSLPKDLSQGVYMVCSDSSIPLNSKVFVY